MQAVHYQMEKQSVLVFILIWRCSVKVNQDILLLNVEFIIAAGWLAGKAGNKDCNPYYEYSSKIKKEAEEIMSIRESFEARGMAHGEVTGRAEGEIIGRIAILAENKYPDIKIIKYLMTLENNPLTQEEAEKFLKEYYKNYIRISHLFIYK